MLAPILHLISTIGLSTTRLTTVTTFANDTGIGIIHKFTSCFEKPLEKLIKIQIFLRKWRIKVEEKTSTFVAFELNKDPSVSLNDTTSKRCKISRTISQQKIDVGKTHSQEEAAAAAWNQI